MSEKNNESREFKRRIQEIKKKYQRTSHREKDEVATMEVKLVKLKLKDIKPNPHRDFTLFPIEKEKVKDLENSIKITGELWYFLPVRKKGDEYELI